MNYILEELNNENILESLYRNINDFILMIKNSATFFSGTIIKIDSKVKKYSVLKASKPKFNELRLSRKIYYEAKF